MVTAGSNTLNLLVPPSKEDIYEWLSSLNPNIAELYSNAIVFYCMGLRNLFSRSRWPWPTPAELDEITDIWIQGLIEQDVHTSTNNMEFILAMPSLCLDGHWVCSNMGNVLWISLLSEPGNPRFVPGSGLLYAYLVWRYERKMKELRAMGSLAESIGNVSLDDGSSLMETP